MAMISEKSSKTNIYILDYERNTSELLKVLDSRNENQFALILYLNEIPILKKSDGIFFVKKPIEIKTINKYLSEILNQLLLSNKNSYHKTIPKTKIYNSENLSSNDSQHNHLFNAISSNTHDGIHEHYKSQRYVGSNKDINTKKKNTEHLFLHKEKFLYHHMINAITQAQANQQNIQLEIFSKQFHYNLKSKKFYHDLSTSEFKYFQTSSFNSTDFHYTSSKTNKNNFHISIDSERIIWFSALQASRGRVPVNTDLDKKIILKNWPNFPKLKIFGHAIQIVAFWSLQKASLLQTANQLKIPQRYIFSLYCAMEALNLVKIDSRNESENLSKVNTYKNKSSIFSKIIAHFFKPN